MRRILSIKQYLKNTFWDGGQAAEQQTFIVNACGNVGNFYKLQLP